MLNLKIIFTWWNKQTFGTFLKTLFQENTLAKMNLETNIIKIKKMKGGLFTQNVEATRITSEWYLWMHHTINKIPTKKKKISNGKKVIRK